MYTQLLSFFAVLISRRREKGPQVCFLTLEKCVILFDTKPISEPYKVLLEFFFLSCYDVFFCWIPFDWQKTWKVLTRDILRKAALRILENSIKMFALEKINRLIRRNLWLFKCSRTIRKIIIFFLKKNLYHFCKNFIFLCKNLFFPNKIMYLK